MCSKNDVRRKFVDSNGIPSKLETVDDVSHNHNPLSLHVRTENLQNIRNDAKFTDFLVGLDNMDFDLACLCGLGGVIVNNW